MLIHSLWHCADSCANFVGANNELQNALKEMDHLEIKNYLQGSGTDWILWSKNPPRASHMGGVLEQ